MKSGGASSEPTYKVPEREESAMVVLMSADVVLAFVSFFWGLVAVLVGFRYWPEVVAMFVLTLVAFVISQIESNVDPAKLNVNNTVLMHVVIAALNVGYLATLTITLWAMSGLL